MVANIYVYHEECEKGRTARAGREGTMAREGKDSKGGEGRDTLPDQT